MKRLIDAEELLKAVANANIESPEDAMDIIDHAPDAQPERKKGHWIDAVIPNDSGGLPVIVCDKCNTFFPLQFGDGHNFCPNCGADMRGEQDETY